MKRLVGNQKSIKTDWGDKSIGFYKGFYSELMNLLSWEDHMGNPSLVADVDYICMQAFKKGYLLDRVDAYYAWSEYSNQESAHWLLGANLETCRKFLVEIEISETPPPKTFGEAIDTEEHYRQVFIKWNEYLKADK